MNQLISTSNIIQFPAPKPPTWMQMATRLYNDSRQEFSMLCHIARLGAQQFSFPRDNSFFALIDNMELLKKSSWELNYAIRQIKEEYDKVYSISDPEKFGPSDLADVIPFRGNKKEGLI